MKRFSYLKIQIEKIQANLTECVNDEILKKVLKKKLK
jgi:hypothetical protein